jgi:GNAT superfamily N-acetyltransferase
MRTYRLLIGAYHAQMENPQARPATASDANEIARLRWEFSTEEREPTEAHDAFLRRMAADVRQHLASGRWSIWVADDPGHAGRLIGTLFLLRVDKVARPYPRPPAWGYISNVYVAPEWRDRGVGGQLLDVAIAEARREGLDTLILWPNRRAIPFYERVGFAPATGAMEMPLGEP